MIAAVTWPVTRNLGALIAAACVLVTLLIYLFGDHWSHSGGEKKKRQMDDAFR
jgi:hypothetical protein